jgi:hypothetical protein
MALISSECLQDPNTPTCKKKDPNTPRFYEMANTHTVLFQICSVEEPGGNCCFKGTPIILSQQHNKKYCNKFRNISEYFNCGSIPKYFGPLWQGFGCG